MLDSVFIESEFIIIILCKQKCKIPLLHQITEVSIVGKSRFLLKIVLVSAVL